MMEIITTFSNELAGLYKTKPPISKAKMVSITKCAMKAGKFFKHIVHNVEKFIAKCPPHYKVPGLYVIDSIIKQSRHQFGVEKDLYGARFAKNFEATFKHILQCSETDKAKVRKVLNIWLKHGVFTSDVIQPLLRLVDKAPPPPPKPGTSQEEDPQLLLQSIQEQLASQPPGAPIDNALMVQIQTLTEKLIQQTLDQSSGSDVLANPDLLKQIQDISNALLQSETDEPADEHRSPESDSSQSSLKKYRSRESWERPRGRKGFPPPRDGCVTVCSRTIWVGSLRPTIGDLELMKLFDDYGEVESVHMIHSRGCAFLVMKERAEAHLALKSLRNARLQGVTLKMDWAPGKGAKEPKYREFWDVDLGVFYVPYKKMPKNMVALAEGGWIEKQTLTDELKKTYEKQLRKAKTTQQQDPSVGNALPPVNMSLLQHGLPGVLQTVPPVMNVPHSPAVLPRNEASAPQSAQRTLTEVLANWAKQQSDLGLVSDMPVTTEALAVQGLQAISQQLTQMGHAGLAGLSALGPPVAPPPPLLPNSQAPTPLMAVDTGQARLLGEHRLPDMRNVGGLLPVPSTPPGSRLGLNRPPELFPHSHIPIVPQKLIPGGDQMAPIHRDLTADHQAYLGPSQRSVFLQNQEHSNRGLRDNRQPGRWNTDDKKSGRGNRNGQRISRWGPQENRWTENKGWGHSENLQQDPSFSSTPSKWDLRRSSLESFNKPQARKSRWKSEGIYEDNYEERMKTEHSSYELPFAFGSTKWNNEESDPHALPMSFESKKWMRFDDANPSPVASSKWQKDLRTGEQQEENNSVLPVALRGGKYNKKADKNNPNILPLGVNSRMERRLNKGQNAHRDFSREEKMFGMENSNASNLNKLVDTDDPNALPMSFSSTKWNKSDNNYDFPNSFGSSKWKAEGAVRSFSKDSSYIPAKTTSPQFPATGCPENMPHQQFMNPAMNGDTQLASAGHSESMVTHQFASLDTKGGPTATTGLSDRMGCQQFVNPGMQGDPRTPFETETDAQREEILPLGVTASQRREPLPPGVAATEYCDLHHEGEKPLFDNLPDSESDKAASITATVSLSDHTEVDSMWMQWNDSVRNPSLSEMPDEPLSEEGGDEPPPPGTEEIHYKQPTKMNCDASLLAEGQYDKISQNDLVSKANHSTEQKNNSNAIDVNDDVNASQSKIVDGFVTGTSVDIATKETNSIHRFTQNLSAGLTNEGNTDRAREQETSDNDERDEKTEDTSRVNSSKCCSFGIAAFLQQIQGTASTTASTNNSSVKQ